MLGKTREDLKANRNSNRVINVRDPSPELDADQYLFFQTMIGLKFHGLDSDNVQFILRSDHEKNSETFYYIPDILRLAIKAHKTLDEYCYLGFPILPLDTKYLGNLQINGSCDEPDVDDWLSCEEGINYWSKLRNAVAIGKKICNAKMQKEREELYHQLEIAIDELEQSGKLLDGNSGLVDNSENQESDLFSASGDYRLLKQDEFPNEEPTAPGNVNIERPVVPIKPPLRTNDFYDEIFLPAIKSFIKKNNCTPSAQELWTWLACNQVNGYTIEHIKSRHLLRIKGFKDTSKAAFNGRYKRYYPPEKN
jgi:hypothetical protein